MRKVLVRSLFCLFFVISVSAFPGSADAGSPAGILCFQDSVDGTWFLDLGAYLSGINFDVHGFRTSPTSCNGTFVQPVTGTAVLDGNTVVLGLTSIATSPACVSVVWQTVIDSGVLSGTGWFMTMLGALGPDEEGPFTLTVISCDVFFQAAKNKTSGGKDPVAR